MSVGANHITVLPRASKPLGLLVRTAALVILSTVILVGRSNAVSSDAASADRSSGREAVALLYLRFSGSDEPFCKGSVIGPRAILTAAHCVDSRPAEDIYVSVAGQSVSLEDIKIHPHYQPQLGPKQFPRNDVAVLFADRQLPVAPLPVLTSETVPPDDSFATFSQGADGAWVADAGTRFVVTPYESVLKVLLASLPGAPRHPEMIEELRRRLEAGDPWLKDKMEAEFGGLIFSIADGQSGSICLGDSGSPALGTRGNNTVVTGVASAIGLLHEEAPEGCHSGGLSIFTRLSDPATIQFLEESGADAEQL